MLVLTGLFLFFYYFRAKVFKIITPFILAAIISYLLHPMVIKLERKRIKRTFGILLIYLFFSLTVASIILFVLPEVIRNVRELIVTIPEITSRYQVLFNNFISTIQSSDWPPDIKNTIFREIENGLAMFQLIAIDTLRGILVKLVGTITTLFDVVLAMIIAYYLIKDAEFFKESFLSLTPRRWRNGMVGTGREINLILSNFIQGQLLTALIVGTMEMAGLSIVRVKYPLILGVIGGIANIIPYFGPILGAIPAVAIAIIDSPTKALWTVLVFVIIQQIDNAFISPKIIEGKLGLHPVTTILAVLIGGEFAGIFGMLVSVPIAAIIKVIFKRAVEAIV
jgi:predicted PurR-regulated permease PerM